MKYKHLPIAALLIFLIASFTAYAETIPINAKVTSHTHSSDLTVRSVKTQWETYISADDALKGMGYQLGWDGQQCAVVIFNPSKNTNMYIYINEDKIFDGTDFISFNGGIITKPSGAYITLDVINALTKGLHTYTLEPAFADSDYNSFRRNGPIKEYNNIYLMNGWYAFEKVDITNEALVDYAQSVNTFAKSLPENVNIYNMLIPNSSEFYAPKHLCSELSYKYRIIYSLLDKKIKPVDIIPELFYHADEYIFFNTDHHWTQKGAYYAYRKFMNVQDKWVGNYPETFTQINSLNVVGSFASLMPGTEGEAQIIANSELLVRYHPPYNVTKHVYHDQNMEQFFGEGPLINNNIMAYGTFMGGDVPVAKLHNTDLHNGKTLCIIKDSYANAFATWAICDYEYVYLVDIRCFNGANGHPNTFSISEFYNKTSFDDLLIMSYPNTVADKYLRQYIRNLGN